MCGTNEGLRFGSLNTEVRMCCTPPLLQSNQFKSIIPIFHIDPVCTVTKSLSNNLGLLPNFIKKKKVKESKRGRGVQTKTLQRRSRALDPGGRRAWWIQDNMGAQMATWVAKCMCECVELCGNNNHRREASERMQRLKSFVRPHRNGACAWEHTNPRRPWVGPFL